MALAIACLTSASAIAAAPEGRYSTTAATVIDNRLKLTWQRVVDDGIYTQAAAGEYCDALVLAELSDWRLPTMWELESIVDFTQVDPAIDPTAFPNTPGEHFWSSTRRAESNTTGWVIRFSDGFAYYPGRAFECRVRCVR